MARSKVFDEEQALNAVMLAFWKSGYNSTSIQDLERATGLKRTSIYNAFGDKRQLFQLVLQRYLDLLGIPAALAKPKVRDAITAALNETIKLHFTKGHPGGCLMLLSLLENHHHDEETRKTLEMAAQGMQGRIIARLEQAVSEGELPPGFDCRQAGNQVMAILAGMLVMAKANIPKAELQALVKHSVATLLP